MKDQATNLRMLAGRQPVFDFQDSPWSRMIVITSGKGGVGKSFLSLHLAYALAGMNKKVLLVDSNMLNPALHILSNTDAAQPISFWMKESLPIENSAKIPLAENLDLLANTAPQEGVFSYVQENANLFMELLAPIAASYDYLVMDTQTGLGDWNLSLLQQANMCLQLSITDPTSVIDTYTFIKAALPYLPDPNIKIVVNQVIGEKTGLEAHQNLNMALSHFLNFEVDLISMIPFDMEVKRAAMAQAPLWKISRTSEALLRIGQLADKIASIQTGENQNKNLIYQEVL
jgi:flagellar biosynthesis protein FlhG